MIDIKFLRENPDVVRASQKGRGEDVTIVDRVLVIDEIRRAALSEFETLRAEQNALSKSVGAAKGDEKAALLENAKSLADKVKAADAKRTQVETEANALVMQLSNLLDPEAPIGGEADLVKRRTLLDDFANARRSGNDDLAWNLKGDEVPVEDIVLPPVLT